MLKAIVIAAALVGAGLVSLYFTSGCTPPATAADAGCPTVVSVHRVTATQCAPIELELDSGVVKTVCLNAAQIERAISEMP